MKTGSGEGRPRIAGFTIVETIIVLAVTGALFVAIAATMSGRQNSAEFTHAIQTVQLQIQQIVNQVEDGYYPDFGNFSCVKTGPYSINISAAASQQGTNAGCVFLGKVIQFGSGVAGTTPEKYAIYTVAGVQVDPASGFLPGSTPYDRSGATVVWPGGSFLQYAQANMLEYGITTKWMTYNGATGPPISAVGFLMESGTLNAASGSGFASGTQAVDLVPIPNTTLTEPTGAMAGNRGSINTELANPTLPYNPPGGVEICFVSGSTNQSGLVTIGSAGRQLNVKLEIRSNTLCR